MQREILFSEKSTIYVHLFRRELKKVEVSKTSGTASEDIYKSELWYFDHMMLLCDQELSKPSTSSIADDVSKNKCCCTQTIYL